MELEFDPVKDQINREKHGLPLALGARVLEAPIVVEQDRLRDYGEVRLNAFGLVNDRLLVCTYTMRGEVFRIVSVRKASRQEQRRCLT